ncbi:MAG: sodium:calcium antiporter [Acidobacteria bacterium]|nr:sodium:calcium antiporter [Acidobacteriota bacterium]
MQWFKDLPLWGNIAAFAVGCIFVWFAGTRLSRGADAISGRTKLGEAFVGALLLGGATSLPEIATTVSASVLGRADIAVNNIFGGIAMQVSILALADAVIGRGPISASYRHPGVLLQGTLLVFVLTTATAAIAVGDTLLAGFGIWTLAIFVFVILGLVLIKRYEQNPTWKPIELEEKRRRDEAEEAEDEKTVPGKRFRRMSMPRLVTDMTISGLVVLGAGFAVTQSGEQIAEQTGIGGSFAGAVLLAIATSLPEVSTTVEAARLGARMMAISNIFGTNLFDAALLFVADLGYAKDAAVLNEVGSFAQVGALLGIACTTIYMAGILERKDRSWLRLGPDSILVLMVYGGGLVLLYTLR